VTVSDPTSVVETLRGDQFHICIVDLMMPKLSGIDLLGQIRKVDNDLAVIILTGYPSLETATASIEHDVSAYIKKPFSVDEFRGVIERIARKKGLVLRKEDELHQTIGRNIRELRKTRALTLKQMSRRTKLSVALLRQIERAGSGSPVRSSGSVRSGSAVRSGSGARSRSGVRSGGAVISGSTLISGSGALMSGSGAPDPDRCTTWSAHPAAERVRSAEDEVSGTGEKRMVMTPLSSGPSVTGMGPGLAVTANAPSPVSDTPVSDTL